MYSSFRAEALTATLALKQHGVETELVQPGLAQQKYRSRCDPVLIKAIARGRAWFGELASGRARSLQELARRDGIRRRYIRRLVCLAFLSPELVEASLQGRHPVTLTATGLMELDLPLYLNRKLADSPHAAATTHRLLQKPRLWPTASPIH